ncbi:[protein-PII] uridylyltransferase [Nocardioides cavernaquae]|uniref:[protein-PII] uridylyltransferase n=1 Tax=Nocardioides cavernaquae TaxID=2321396 RepID=UPI0015FF7E34|nr:[protein-PII] uridylyltransferase [Nocardioides cavernaquae]
MNAHDRQRRTAAADELCAKAYADLGGPDVGVALVAVGGYGRAELAPYSDLDVVLVHDEGVDLGELAEKLWYPLWDSGNNIDHSVRSLPETIAAAEADLRVALGMLDARHLAGDPNLTLRLRTNMLGGWRREARRRLPEMHELVKARHDIMGELAHVSIPDLKEAEGGLRDATALKALVASWLVDVPHVEVERCRQALLDTRDVLHAVAGRATDRINPEMWAQLAEPLGLADAGAVQSHVRELGRRMTHIARLTWHRVDQVVARPTSLRGARRPDLRTVAPGIALSSGEIVLDATAKPANDPIMLLRAAAEAAERGVPLAPTTAARLARLCPEMPVPWPEEARHQLVRLLAAGRGLLPVWETLEETRALDRILPEWELIRSLPHASIIHRFTVDRHVVETCIEASELIRKVARPDVLMVAALLHDIGKCDTMEHSVAGEPIAREVAARWGFDGDEVDLVGNLVRWHLLLAETATTRDPDDPATVQLIVDRVKTQEMLSLLTALTEADAKAASPKAWSTWRARLVRHLANRTLAALVAQATHSSAPKVPEQWVQIPREIGDNPSKVHVGVDRTADGSRVTVISGDRVGLLADAAAMFAVQRTSVRAAKVWTQDLYGVSVWDTDEQHLDAAVLRTRLASIVEGRLDARERLSRPRPGRLEPRVKIRPEASSTATVLEIRMDDRPGVVYLVCAALAFLGLSVRSAHVSTLGPQAVDVFYVQEVDGGVLTPDRADQAAHAVREALVRTVTLEA